jgi:Glycosyl transferase family 2
MLSILIPTYNYNAYPLVCELHKQCLECKINFEILCQDDFSGSELNVENNKINLLDNSNFSTNITNLGRGKNINLLAKKAKYDWLLVMDCDTFPTQNNYIKNYIDTILNFAVKIVFGGIAYESTKPEKEKLLRWVYGQKRESLTVAERNKNPNQTLTSNLLVLRSVFIINHFHESITNYGYEDLLFLSELKSKDIIVKHIQNPTYHLGLESSSIFIKKTEIAIENLVFIEENKILLSMDTKIQKTYQIMKSLRIHKFLSFAFKKLQSTFKKQLLSNNPSIFIFDLYKLGYYSNIKR